MSETFSVIPPETDVVSFDLWLTLIKSNGRTFKMHRNEMLRKEFAPDMPEATFNALVRSQDSAADKIAEERGSDVMFAERVGMVAALTGQPQPDSSTIDSLYDRQTALLEKYPPVLLDPDTPRLLDKLHGDHKLVVVSNTGFIHGNEMRLVLDHLGIRDAFDSTVFSNEVGYAKPHAKIFQSLLDQMAVTPDRVTHIGDNVRADVFGAQQIGMHAIHFADGVNLQNIVEGTYA